MKILSIWLVSLLLSGMVMAQTAPGPPNFDQFKKSIAPLDDTTRIKKLIAFSYEQGDIGQFEPAALLLDEAISIAQPLKDKRQISKVYRAYAGWSQRQKNYPEAIQYYQKALSVIPGDTYANQRYTLLILIGNTYYKALDPDRAKAYYEQVINARKPEADLLNKAYAFGGMANLADHQHNAQASVNYNQKAMAIYKQLGQDDSYYGSLLAIAVSYGDLKRPTEAIALYQQCLRYASHIERESPLLSLATKTTVYANIPYPLIALKRFDEAEKYAKLALVTADKDQANLYTHRMWIYDALTLLYETKGDFKKALAAHKQWAVYRDSIQNQTRTQKFAELETRYQAKEQEIQIKQLNEANALKSRQLWAGGSGLVLVSILLGTMIWQYRRIQLSRAKIQQQSSQLSLMMKELHHRVKNNLAIVSSLLKLQSNRLEDESAVRAVRTGQQRVEAMSLIHQRLYQTDQITTVNIREYLTDLAESLMQAYDYSPDDFDLIIDVDQQELDVDVAMPLGLIANELITNAFKYAYAGGQRPLLRIGLHAHNGLTLEVQDNGPGVDQVRWQQCGSRASFGKRLIASLSEQLEGQFDLVPQEGALFRLYIPEKRLRAA